MARIGADLEQLRATIASLRQGNANLQETFQRTRQAMQALQSSPWAGRHRQQAEAVWERIQAQFTPAINALENLTARTEQFAHNLEEAGSRFNDGAAISSKAPTAPGVDTMPKSPLPPGDGARNGQQLPPYRPFESRPTTVPGVLQNTAGCTNYVLRRVNLDDMKRWPDAHEWNEAARDAGYVISDVPEVGSKGAIMVFEAGLFGGAYSSDGHVAYVEQVERDPDGTLRVTISEAKPVENNGEIVWGTHTQPTERTVALQVGEDGKVASINGKPIPPNGVSFILGRRAM